MDRLSQGTERLQRERRAPAWAGFRDGGCEGGPLFGHTFGDQMGDPEGGALTRRPVLDDVEGEIADDFVVDVQAHGIGASLGVVYGAFDLDERLAVTFEIDVVFDRRALGVIFDAGAEDV